MLEINKLPGGCSKLSPNGFVYLEIMKFYFNRNLQLKHFIALISVVESIFTAILNFQVYFYRWNDDWIILIHIFYKFKNIKKPDLLLCSENAYLYRGLKLVVFFCECTKKKKKIFVFNFLIIFFRKFKFRFF